MTTSVGLKPSITQNPPSHRQRILNTSPDVQAYNTTTGASLIENQPGKPSTVYYQKMKAVKQLRRAQSSLGQLNQYNTSNGYINSSTVTEPTEEQKDKKSVIVEKLKK